MITYGVVLAAGAGKRFGGPKAPFLFEGERLVDRAVSTLQRGGCTKVLVVLGAWVGEVPAADEVLINADWPEGLSASLALAIEAVTNSPADRICVTLVDLPGLTAAAVARVLAAENELVSALYQGAPTHPVLIGRAHWGALLATLNGDRGARQYLAAHDDAVSKIEISDLASGEDLDYQPT